MYLTYQKIFGKKHRVIDLAVPKFRETVENVLLDQDLESPMIMGYDTSSETVIIVETNGNVRQIGLNPPFINNIISCNFDFEESFESLYSPKPDLKCPDTEHLKAQKMKKLQRPVTLSDTTRLKRELLNFYPAIKEDEFLDKVLKGIKDTGV